MKQLPLVHATYRYSNPRVMEMGALLSKPELIKNGIPYDKRNADPEIEAAFGTGNDICLHIDLTFEKGMHYGGSMGPRFVFQSDVIHMDGVFILPTDQHAYKGLPSQFFKDKVTKRSEKDALVEAYLAGEIKGTPEVHVPSRLGLNKLAGILGTPMTLDDFARYNGKFKRIEVRSSATTHHPTAENYADAYSRLLQQIEQPTA